MMLWRFVVIPLTCVAGLTYSLGVPILADQAAPPAAPGSGQTAKPPTVLFLCPHGAAKSVLASAYFQRAAKERGLNVTVSVSRN